MDLSTTYLGMRLPHPLVVGRGTARRRSRHRQARSKTPAPRCIVLRSLFEEQITGEQMDEFVNSRTPQRIVRRGRQLLPEPESRSRWARTSTSIICGG